MNHEEAIKKIEQNKSAAQFYMGISNMANVRKNEEQDIEAFDMAIHALRAQMHDGCDECYYEDTPTNEHPCNVCKQNYIDLWTKWNSGAWVDEENPIYAGGGATFCTYCGNGFAWGAYHKVDEWQYCPNCGKRMR